MTTLHVDEDNLLEWDKLALGSSGAYANAATVTATLLKQIATDGAIESGDATLTCTSGPFVSGDVGRTITVKGAGDKGRMLRTTIASVTSATVVELSDAAGKTVTAAKVEMSIDNAQDIDLEYVDDSNGQYQGTLPNTVPLVHDQNYVLEYYATESGADGLRRLACKALYHQEN